MSEPNKYKSLNFLFFKSSKNDEDFSFLSCKIFKSKRPTVDAFCTSIFNPFQFSLIKLFFIKNLLNSSNIYPPLLSSKADSPIMIIGFFADKSF